MTTAFRIITVLTITLLVVAPLPINALNPRKLDETTVGSPNDEIKCGACPCGTTCYASPPPPIPVPSPPPPSPPPPPKKQTPLCPPPPSGGGGGGGGGGGKAPPSYIYVSGPPGDLYPVVQSISAAGRCSAAAMGRIVVTCGILLGMIAFW